MKRKLAHALTLTLLVWTVAASNPTELRNWRDSNVQFRNLAFSPSRNSSTAGWRTASESELRKVIPARAPVIKENIETEFRTASGVTDGQGKFIAGVVMITAGYSAEGKYSHFFIAQVPMKVGDFSLESGEYVFGYKRKTPDSITVTFYRASSGDTVGEVEAFRDRKSSIVRTLLIQPATSGTGTIRIGRFVFDYRLS